MVENNVKKSVLSNMSENLEQHILRIKEKYF